MQLTRPSLAEIVHKEHHNDAVHDNEVARAKNPRLCPQTVERIFGTLFNRLEQPLRVRIVIAHHRAAQGCHHAEGSHVAPFIEPPLSECRTSWPGAICSTRMFDRPDSVTDLLAANYEPKFPRRRFHHLTRLRTMIQTV